MAIVAVPVDKTLVIRFGCGLDENFDPIYRNRSWRNVKLDAPIADVHAVAVMFGDLCDDTLSVVRQRQEHELEDDA